MFVLISQNHHRAPPLRSGETVGLASAQKSIYIQDPQDVAVLTSRQYFLLSCCPRFPGATLQTFPVYISCTEANVSEFMSRPYSECDGTYCKNIYHQSRYPWSVPGVKFVPRGSIQGCAVDRPLSIGAYVPPWLGERCDGEGERGDSDEPGGTSNSRTPLALEE